MGAIALGWELGSGSWDLGLAVAITSFRDLRVWQAGMELATAIYALTQSFPAAERFGLSSQLQRAATSIPSNIAEGHTRAYTREYLHHVAIAHGSLAELETQLELAIRLGYLKPAAGYPMLAQALSLSKQLNALRTALQGRLPSSQPPAPNSQLPCSPNS
ncbi:MAG TPA: four helix bundle protein [Chloroflexota bacterium]|nr:four helix bundle protein [Chloroflexota bacterium]